VERDDTLLLLGFPLFIERDSEREDYSRYEKVSDVATFLFFSFFLESEITEQLSFSKLI
jgi:hypothetical protein